MAEHGLKRLPVVDHAGHLLGMITRSDLLRELIFSETATTWTDGGRDKPLDWEAKVEQVMSTGVVTVEPTTPLSQVVQAMLNAAQKRIIVTNSAKQVVGLITDSDLLMRVHADHRSALLGTLPALWADQPTASRITFDVALQTAADVMTSPVITVNVGATARDALRLLIEYRVKRLPVIDSEGHVVGVVGRAGLLHALLAKPDEYVMPLPAPD